MRKFLSIISTTLALGAGITASAQDIHFSQFYENSILRNPALTGIFSGEFKAGVNYREQWGAVSAPYTTGSATVETRILVNREVGDYLSIGMAAYSDKAGSIDFKSQAIYPTVAFNKALSDKHNSYLSFGFTGGYLSRSVDMAKMKLSSQYVNGFDPSNPSGETAPFNNLGHFDLGAGVSLNSSLGLENRANFYLGASIYHLNRPTQIFNGGYSTVKLPMKLQFNAGINMIFSNVVSLALHGNYSRQQPYSELIFGGLLSFHNNTPGLPSNFAFSMGTFYRVDDAFIPTVKIDYSNVALGVSYDATNSDLAKRVNGTGATEITLYIKTKFKHWINPQDGVMCPRFETPINYPFE